MNLTISDSEFRKFSKLIHEKIGINLHSGKKTLFESRLNKILRKRNISSYGEYYDIVYNDKEGRELTVLINSISTNTTHFFREQLHFDFMTQLFTEEFSSQTSIKGWCAASSTGEEPYSILITMNEIFDSETKKISLLATDIDTNVLIRAKRAIYPIQSAEKIPDRILKKYFKRGAGSATGYIRAKEILRSQVIFKQLNLIDYSYPAEKFDFIFCRNVMIYFKKETKENIVKNMYTCLKDGGYLMVGHAESLSGINHPLKYIQPAIYKRI